MELRQLEHFVAVADLEHFTKAAERLHISQSALSSSVRALERQVGAQLFERTTRRVLLTSAGAVLLSHARRIIGDVAAARDDLRGVDNLESGSLAVAAVQTFTAVDLPAVLETFHQDYPRVQVVLREATTTTLLDAVEDGSLDCAFVALDAQPVPTSLFTLRTYDEPLTAVVGASHPLADRRRVALSTLGEYPYVDFEAGVGLQTVVDALFHDSKVERDIAFRVSDMRRLLDLVERGLGVAVIPVAIAQERPTLQQLDIDVVPAPRRSLALVSRTRRPVNSAARVFLDRIGIRESRVEK
ncbi:LysR substrate-binding domain-containing protein [Rhodococcus sp. B10]|uniref:LysR family transcriptional regulator n=1 Tax=Rhodococcus sp. B10 TaxID=2695876 RepID=UPI00143152B7|nr:LysR substrate-binding domain-containing protein [Rhodococcus sp. B10]NIL74340.1 Hydrogen peroxide-inducible genes activator [Rhodococcus sp. B10]